MYIKILANAYLKKKKNQIYFPQFILIENSSSNKYDWFELNVDLQEQFSLVYPPNRHIQVAHDWQHRQPHQLLNTTLDCWDGNFPEFFVTPNAH